MTDNALAPCPLCGAEAESCGYADSDQAFVQCTDCHCSVDVGNDGYEIWNTRAGQPVPWSKAATDVLAERHRQIADEGWTPAHDDDHDAGELAAAACAYALYAADELHPQSQGDGDYGREIPPMWPFHVSWYKPDDPRRALVKAAALILAEIERIDRGAS